MPSTSQNLSTTAEATVTSNGPFKVVAQTPRYRGNSSTILKRRGYSL